VRVGDIFTEFRCDTIALYETMNTYFEHFVEISQYSFLNILIPLYLRFSATVFVIVHF
jgi:hypothetical protein